MPHARRPDERARAPRRSRPRRSDRAPSAPEAKRRQPPTTPDAHYSPRSEREFALPDSVVGELRDSLERQAGGAAPSRSSRSVHSREALERRLTAAAAAYEKDRYEDALSTIRPVFERAPDAPAVLELYGLTLYRLGRWRQAARQLRRLHELTGSYDQHPVIADCERALGHLDKVRALWDELRRAGVDRDVLVEGRLVMAGALADSGELVQAIELLGPEAANKKHPDLRHLRQWYALADLFERAGDLPRARQLFARVAHVDAEVLDAPERLAALR